MAWAPLGPRVRMAVVGRDSSPRVREQAGHGQWAPGGTSRISELRAGLGEGVGPRGSGPERDTARQAWLAGVAAGTVLVWRKEGRFRFRVQVQGFRFRLQGLRGRAEPGRP